MKGICVPSTIAAALLLGSGTDAHALKPAPTSCQASKANADAVTKGMAYDAIVALVGCEGTLVSENKLGPNGPVVAMRWWSGNGGDKSFFKVQLWDGKMAGKGAYELQ
ncbi:MAG: hypothetical protein ACTHNH_08990 [Mesorhizobium sp.]